MIEAVELCKRYRGRAALDGFSFHVERGEVLGLVGPNGAGKTTLITVLATLVRPDAGRAVVAGHDVVAAAREVRAVVGYLPDIPGVYQDMRVAEFLDFFAAAFRLRGPRRRAAVEGALRRAGLADRRREFVEHLSMGLRQRLCLAKMLLHGPKVLLLDEPAMGLDPLARIELRQLLREVNQDGVTILISSHLLSDLEELCDRIALIADGRNVLDPAEGSALTMKRLHADRSLCDVEFLGDTPRILEVIFRWPGAQVREQRPERVHVEIPGGTEEAARFLRHLVDAGITVVRFDPRRGALEERYRRAFRPGEP